MNAITRLPEITERIVNASQPEKIILFGSYARGDFGPHWELIFREYTPLKYCSIW